jgi:O-antigen ligase
MSFILVIIGVIIFILQSRKIQFYIFSLSAFFQFTLGNIGSIPKFLLIEWITPLFFIILINEMIPVYGLRRKQKLFDFRGVEIFIFAIILLVITASVSYGRNEIFAEQFRIATNATGTKRAYWGIMNNILIFFVTLIYLSRYKLKIEEWIKLLLICSIALGLLRLMSYFLDISIPFISGGFDYNPGGSTKYGGLTFRIGGLAEATLVGISALLADFYLKKKLNIFYTIALLIIQFMSGGRTMLIAIIVAIAIYSTFFLKRTMSYVLLLGGIGFIVIIIFLPQKVIEGQIGRMTSFSGGVEEQSSERYIASYLLLKSFQENPVFGKGISDYDGLILVKNEETREFIRSVQVSGGHGSYTSMLGIFGIVGLLFFLILLLGTIFLSFRKLKQYMGRDEHICSFLTFIFVVSVMGSIYFITSYNGFGITYIFFNAGLIVSMKVCENKNKLIY